MATIGPAHKPTFATLGRSHWSGLTQVGRRSPRPRRAAWDRCRCSRSARAWSAAWRPEPYEAERPRRTGGCRTSPEGRAHRRPGFARHVWGSPRRLAASALNLLQLRCSASAPQRNRRLGFLQHRGHKCSARRVEGVDGSGTARERRSNRRPALKRCGLPRPIGPLGNHPQRIRRSLLLCGAFGGSLDPGGVLPG